MGTTRLKTVKAPSIKADFKEELMIDVMDQIRMAGNEYRDLLDYSMRRVEKLEEKDIEREVKRLSISDWFMIACYSVIIIGVVVITLKTLKNSKHGHS